MHANSLKAHDTFLLQTLCICHLTTTERAKWLHTVISILHLERKPCPYLEGSTVVCMQDGKYVDTGTGFHLAANVSRPVEGNGFTAFNHTDLQNNTDLYQMAVGQECTKQGSKYESLVKECKDASTTTAQCCVNFKGKPQAEVSPFLHPQLLQTT